MAEHSGSAWKSNKPVPEQVQLYVREIEKLKDEKVAEHMSYMSRCAKINEKIRDWKDRAKDAGIPKRELNDLLKLRELEDERQDILDGQGDEDRGDMVQMLADALGMFADTPLGQAAQAAAAKPKKPEKKPSAKETAEGLPEDADAPASRH